MPQIGKRGTPSPLLEKADATLLSLLWHLNQSSMDIWTWMSTDMDSLSSPIHPVSSSSSSIFYQFSFLNSFSPVLFPSTYFIHLIPSIHTLHWQPNPSSLSSDSLTNHHCFWLRNIYAQLCSAVAYSKGILYIYSLWNTLLIPNLVHTLVSWPTKAANKQEREKNSSRTYNWKLFWQESYIKLIPFISSSQFVLSVFTRNESFGLQHEY